MTTQFTIKELLKQFKQISDEMDLRVKNEGKNILKPLFQEVFNNHPGLNVIAYIGYTPGFNDGEPCEHTQTLYMGVANSYGFDFDDYEDELEEVFKKQTKGEVTTHKNSDCANLGAAFVEVTPYNELIERIFSTNFKVVISRKKDGTIKIDSDEYDCGF